MPDPKMVSTEDAQRYASQMGIEFFETGAKTTKNVKEIYNANVTFSVFSPTYETIISFRKSYI